MMTTHGHERIWLTADDCRNLSGELAILSLHANPHDFPAVTELRALLIDIKNRLEIAEGEGR